MIQIGKSEDSSNLYLSFCIKKECIDSDSIEAIDVATKQMLIILSTIIDEATKNLRIDSLNTSYYMQKLKNYSSLMDVINSASNALKELVTTEETEELVEEKKEEI